MITLQCLPGVGEEWVRGDWWRAGLIRQLGQASRLPGTQRHESGTEASELR